MIRKVIYTTFSLILSLPVITLAQGSAGRGNTGGGTAGRGNTGGDVNRESVSLQNPLGDQTLMGFLEDVLDVIMVFAVPIIVFFIIYAGFQYVMARGNQDGVTKASRALLYAIIGGLIILGAQLLLAVISGTVTAFRS